MSNVMIRGLMKVHNKNRRSQNEQARELNHTSVTAHTVVLKLSHLLKVAKYTVPLLTVVVPTPNDYSPANGGSFFMCFLNKSDLLLGLLGL